jgi:hypothetical protein
VSVLASRLVWDATPAILLSLLVGFGRMVEPQVVAEFRQIASVLTAASKESTWEPFKSKPK